MHLLPRHEVVLPGRHTGLDANSRASAEVGKRRVGDINGLELELFSNADEVPLALFVQTLDHFNVLIEPGFALKSRDLWLAGFDDRTDGVR